MPRERKRVCLQDGPFLNLSWLVKNQIVQVAAPSPHRSINWTRNSVEVASAIISADLSQGSESWLKIWIGGGSQEINLAAQARHFGGHQWYFVCPVTGRLASVVWRPPGATLFASRHAWGSQVAYLSQFGTWIDRCHLGKERIKARLSDSENPENIELPPRPRGMHRQTYDDLAKRFGAYEGKLNNGLALVIEKWSLQLPTDFE